MICDQPDDRRALLDIQICKGTPTCPPPVPVSTICPWAFQAIKGLITLFLLETGQELFSLTCEQNSVHAPKLLEIFLFFFFFFWSRAWEFFAVINVTTSGPRRVIVFVPLSTSPRQPLCPPRTDARNRILEIIASDCSTYFELMWVFFLEGGGGWVHFIHCIIALTLDPGEYVLMPTYCAMRTTVQTLNCGISPFSNVTSLNLWHDSTL